MQEGEAIESGMVSRRIEGAQKKVEERNFEIRKNLLEYDEIMDTQRKRVYGFRQEVLEGVDCKGLVLEMIDHQIDEAVEAFMARDYGQSTFAAWAAHRLGTEFDAKDFSRCDFVQAERLARDEAVKDADSFISEFLDENLNQEVEEREWNWEAVANMANSRWGLKLKAYDLKRMGRDEVGVHLEQLAEKAISQVSLDAGEEFFADNFGLRNLLGWASQKLATPLTIDAVPVDSRSDSKAVAKLLKAEARKVYERKELEFPVSCGMTRFMADKSQNAAARYDRDGLLEWAGRRFRTNVDAEEFKNLPRQKVIEELLECHREFREHGDAVLKTLNEEIAKRLPDDDKAELSIAELEDVSKWSEMNLGKPLSLGKADRRVGLVRRQLQSAWADVYRAELHEAERALLLQFLDTGWKDHLYAMDHLRSSIGLVGYAQIDPKVEYKRRGKQLFEEMWSSFENKVTDLIFRVEEVDPSFVTHLWQITNAVHESYSPGSTPVSGPPTTDGSIRDQQDAAIEMSKGEQKTAPIRNRPGKVGRNDPCRCGSGKKYKNCCMNKDRAAG
jgi:preprotein translocase subunit SecA